jgi:hypothetical protein
MFDLNGDWEIPYPSNFKTWELTYSSDDGKRRPWTTNKDRNFHPMQRAKLIKSWREAYCELATKTNIPELEVMFIEAIPLLRNRNFQDTAACNPAVKAAIDGIVDAGVVPDDSKQWLKWILFRPCQLTPGIDGLTIRVIGKISETKDQLTFL